MKNLFGVLILTLLVGAMAFAAVSLPYTTTFQTDNIGTGNWTSSGTGGVFVNNSTVASGDGDDFSVSKSGNIGNGNLSDLVLTFSTTGLTFNGGETFTFRWRATAAPSSNREVMRVLGNGSQIGADINLTSTTYTTATVTLPSALENLASVTLTVRLAHITNGNAGTYSLFVDNPTLDGGALPIQLSSFSAGIIENNVRLDWSTETESNNYGWYVERQAENEASYSEVANSFTAGAGTTLDPQTYSFVDENIAAGTYNYRLRQVDLNGAVSYSAPVQVVVNGILGVGDGQQPDVFRLAQNYPNPFNPSTKIAYSIANAGLVSLKVFNMLGQEVATLVNEVQGAGVHNASFDASKLSSGIYLYRLSSGTESSVKRMMLVK